MSSVEKNQPRILNAWCSYDWANSVYALTISSAVFPVYYNTASREAFGSDTVLFFGWAIENTVLYSYALSVSFLLVVFLSPILSGMADYGGIKKRMIKLFTYTGSVACMGLFYFDGKNIEYGILLSILASLGYAGALVFYNAYLPEIATVGRMDKVSAKGYAMGYTGSVIQLVFSLTIILNPDWFGLEAGSFPARLSFLAVGIWWMGFAQIAFHYLPSNLHQRPPISSDLLRRGFDELKKVWKSLPAYPLIKKYLVAFFFYSTGVQTVMLLAATFGEKTLRLPEASLIMTVLAIQLVAIGGAYLFAYLSGLFGNRWALLVMIGIWVGICLAAYLVQNAFQFYLLAAVVGLVMGGIQSLSRSTYAKLVPKDTIDTASYFSFYDVIEKVSIVLGTFTYGLMEQMTGNVRNSALAMAFFFLVGLVLMFRLPYSQKVQNALN